MSFGPYGLDPYGADAEFPHELRDFKVVAAMEGPQALLSWGPPLQDIGRLMVRRKQREYPRHPEDGVLVFDATENMPDQLYCNDVGSDLLPADAAEGDGAWWYYRAFVQPAPLPLEDQFGGRARQESPDPVFVGMLPAWIAYPWDVQLARDFTVVVHNTTAAPVQYWLATAPEATGPWADIVSSVALAAGEAVAVPFVDAALKYVRGGANAEGVVFTIIAPRQPKWATSMGMSAPCYVYKSGRHHRLAWIDGHLPSVYINEDLALPPTYLSEAQDSTTKETFNLGLLRSPQGPLERFLRVMLAEMDRTHAHMVAVREFTYNIGEAPEALLQHLAYELGYRVDTSQPLEDVRQEILRVAGMWKERGTALQFERIVSQLLGLVPRVQESAGQLMRFVDPDIF